MNNQYTNRQFNQKSTNKDMEIRGEINDRMQRFMTPNYCNNQNTNEDFSVKSQQFDKNAYKNDINNRMNSFRTSENIHLKRLPFNNNIRDYSITVDSKKDEFNERLSNYNRLSSNMVPNVDMNSNYGQSGFHNNFKDDLNQRMEKLYPLSRNMGIPTVSNVPNLPTQRPKTPDFNNNLSNDSYIIPKTQEEYNKQQQMKMENEQQKIYSKINMENVFSNSYDFDGYSSFDYSKPNNTPSGNTNTNNSGNNNNHSSNNNNQSGNNNNQSSNNNNEFDYSLINNAFSMPLDQEQINHIEPLTFNNNLPMNTRQQYNFSPN